MRLSSRERVSRATVEVVRRVRPTGRTVAHEPESLPDRCGEGGTSAHPPDDAQRSVSEFDLRGGAIETRLPSGASSRSERSSVRGVEVTSTRGVTG
jgi:hypothetical protein